MKVLQCDVCQRRSDVKSYKDTHEVASVKVPTLQTVLIFYAHGSDIELCRLCAKGIASVVESYMAVQRGGRPGGRGYEEEL